jgi:hypothetical protein
VTRIALSIWTAALALYGVFWLWYVGIPNPLTPAEVDTYLEQVRGAQPLEPEQRAALRAFLAADDGGEFFMLNLVRMQPGDVLGPGASEPRPAREVMAGYANHFMPALLRRAGHPAFMGRAAAGYLEQWQVPPDPGWTFGAAIRYRSRRDLIELVVDPRFRDAHLYKFAAVANTFAFPTTPAYVVVGPKIWVALALALLAALAQIGVGAVLDARRAQPGQ